ncbi:hypothetical protein N8I77_001650 [Diaporthe amygdali]|uniref:Uncharacterized protein n=1 Tax=Phomopsis amygdali TaxID=1214568 RepID=A0AAD9WAZ8_PHOAM|nr:hypothetical protein N8I77_001650 [Diaporthe amygdali]
MDKLKDILSPRGKKDDDHEEQKRSVEVHRPSGKDTVKSPLAQGHLKDEASSPTVQISAPAELTGLTGQYLVGKDDSLVSDQERQKHGTSNGLASATMASGAIGEQNPLS